MSPDTINMIIRNSGGLLAVFGFLPGTTNRTIDETLANTSRVFFMPVNNTHSMPVLVRFTSQEQRDAAAAMESKERVDVWMRKCTPFFRKLHSMKKRTGSYELRSAERFRKRYSDRYFKQSLNLNETVYSSTSGSRFPS